MRMWERAQIHELAKHIFVTSDASEAVSSSARMFLEQALVKLRSYQALPWLGILPEIRRLLRISNTPP